MMKKVFLGSALGILVVVVPVLVISVQKTRGKTLVQSHQDAIPLDFDGNSADETTLSLVSGLLFTTPNACYLPLVFNDFPGSALDLGEACTDSSQCLSGNCVDDVCCNTDCPGTCMACAASKTGVDDGMCAMIPYGTDPDNECGAGFCSGAGYCVNP